MLSVDLSSNQINQVTSILNGRKYLQQANFSKNVIESFTAKEWNLLTFLNLSENKLTELDLDGFKTLVHLDISSNKLSNTRGINIPTLKKLYLAKNSIEKVSDIARLVNLQILHLRDNKVSDLSGFDVGLNELATLNLRSNAIQEFSELDKLTNLVNLKNLTLSDNPISQLANYRLEVVMRLGKLVKLDKDVVTDDERDEAASYKKQQIKEAAENAQRKLEEKEAEEALAREQAEADAELLRQAEAMKKDEEEEVQEGEDN